METLHGNLMETEAAMETQAAPAFFLAALDGDAETVSKMLSTAGAQSLINYQHALGDTPLLTALGASPLLAAAANGHVAVTEQLLEARSKMDMLPSQRSSLKPTVTWIFRERMGAHRSSSRPK
jgi:ankyrin repeat protein